MTDLISRIEGPITSPEDFAMKLSAAAVRDVTLTPTRRPSRSGAAGSTAQRPTPHPADNRTSSQSSGPVASTRRLHVAHLDANPPHPLERWLCSWSYRYRRALGDSRVVALRRALACACSHREVIA